MSPFSSTVSRCNVFCISSWPDDIWSFVSLDRLLATSFEPRWRHLNWTVQIISMCSIRIILSSWKTRHVQVLEVTQLIMGICNKLFSVYGLLSPIWITTNPPSTSLHPVSLQIKTNHLVSTVSYWTWPYEHLESSKISISQVWRASMCFTNRLPRYPTIWKCASLWPHPKCPRSDDVAQERTFSCRKEFVKPFRFVGCVLLAYTVATTRRSRFLQQRPQNSLFVRADTVKLRYKPLSSELFIPDTWRQA